MIKSRIKKTRKGFSLLEVILAVAILGGALVVIGQLHNLGYRHAIAAKHRSDANILLDTKMAEVTAGVVPLESAAGSFENFADWSFSVDVQPSNERGLLIVTVEVTNGSLGLPLKVFATRFMPDPDYNPLEDLE